MLVALGAFVAVHAQSSRDEARRVVLGRPKTTTTQQSRTIILGRNPQQQTRVYRTNRTVYYGKKPNHGKHLGWYKGVGNPHRYGVQPGKGNKKWKHDRDDD